MAFDASRVINGTFGEVHIDGQWETNFNHLEARVEIRKAELLPSGDRWARHKVVGLKGTGTISGFKVTSRLIELNADVRDNSKGSVKTEIVSKLADPEAFGHERIRLKNVMFDQISLANWTTGEVVNEEWPFTFEDYELVDPISEGGGGGGFPGLEMPPPGSIGL
jgi:hypothetical protein